MGQVTKVQLSCDLGLLSTDSKTSKQDNHTFVTWPISYWILSQWNLGVLGAKQAKLYIIFSRPIIQRITYGSITHFISSYIFYLPSQRCIEIETKLFILAPIYVCLEYILLASF